MFSARAHEISFAIAIFRSYAGLKLNSWTKAFTDTELFLVSLAKRSGVSGDRSPKNRLNPTPATFTSHGGREGIAPFAPLAATIVSDNNLTVTVSGLAMLKTE